MNSGGVQSAAPLICCQQGLRDEDVIIFANVFVNEVEVKEEEVRVEED